MNGLTNGGGLWRTVLEKHGFGAVVILLLLGSLLGIIPTPLSDLKAHTARDAQTATMMMAVCLNIGELNAAVKGISVADVNPAMNRCWDAMYGTGPISEAVKQLNRQPR